MKNAVIFARVSTKEQSNDRQINDLQIYATKHGLKVVSVITEVISGTRRNADRKGISRLIETCKAEKAAVVLVSEMSRIGRNAAETLATIQSLTDSKINLYIQNMNLETLDQDGKATAQSVLICASFAAIAQVENIHLKERTKSGLEQAKRNGKVLGRPKVSETAAAVLAKYPKVVQLLKQGQSIRNAAKIADVTPPTVLKVSKILKQQKTA